METNTYGWFQQTPDGNQDGFNYGNIGNYWFGNDRNDLYGGNWGRHDGDNSHDRDGYKKWTKTMEQYSWNAANRLEQQMNWKGEITKFSYDGDGNRLSMTSGYFKDWNPGRDADWNWGSDRDPNWNNLNHNFQDSENNNGHGNKGSNLNQGYHGYQHLTQDKFTNDVSLPLPEVIQVISSDNDKHYDQQRTTFVFGPGQERLSMTREGFVDGDHDRGNGQGYSYGHENGGRFPNTSYYVKDALGSTIAMLNQKGHLTERNHYDEFGNPESRGYGFAFGNSHDNDLGNVNGNDNGLGYGLGNDGLYHGNGNLFGYTGLEYDGSTGLNYARARYYKPEIGRFISEDTYKGILWNPQSQNGYVYVHNNPINWIDPSGHRKKSDNDYLANLVEEYTNNYALAQKSADDCKRKGAVCEQRGYFAKYQKEVAERGADAVRVAYYTLHGMALPDDITYTKNNLDAPDITEKFNGLLLKYEYIFSQEEAGKTEDLKTIDFFFIVRNK